MAGAGYKLFNTGDVLTAADVNTYLMQQTIMVFANATARDTAVSGVLAQGMQCFLKDTNTMQYYNGSAWTTLSTGGDITSVVAGTGISGGGTSGDVTVTNSMATAMTTKGDLVPATGSGTFARLAAGSDGSTLVADSSASTGLRWQGVSAVRPNFAVNGNFDFWQRGTSFTSSGYTADRWYATIVGTTTVAQETSIVPDGSTYALKWTTGASSSYAEIYNAFEAQDVNALGGKTVTVSVQVRAQASFASTFRLRLQTNTTANTQTGGAWTTVVTTDATPSTSAFGVVTATYTVPVGTKGLRIALQPAAAQASGTGLYLGQAQLEIGSVATPYKYSGGTLQGELAACQRYFNRVVDGNNAVAGIGFSYSTASQEVGLSFPKMRVAPTMSVSAATHFQVENNGSNRTAATLSFIKTSTNSTIIDGTNTGGMTAGVGVILVSISNSAAIDASAEL